MTDTTFHVDDADVGLVMKALDQNGFDVKPGESPMADYVVTNDG